MQTITVEQFNDPNYSRPRYRLRYSKRQNWLKDGHTCGSYKLKRDAQAHADALNKETAMRQSLSRL